MSSYGQNQAPLGAPWARVRLLRGQSGTFDWSIGPAHPEARLTVGSAIDATWAVEGPGVLPYHLELFWDGRRLWVADATRTGSVELDGRAIVDWVQVEDGSEIVFGSAAMAVEWGAEGTPGYPESDERATSINIGLANQIEDDELAAEATRVRAPLSDFEDLHPPQPVAPGTWTDSTYIAPDGQPLASPPGGGPLRPHLGGEGAPSQALVQTMSEEEMSAHVAKAQQRLGQMGEPSMTSEFAVAKSAGFVAPPEVANSPGRGGPRVPVRTIILLIVTVLVGGGVGLWALLTPTPTPTPTATPTPPTLVAPPPPQAAAPPTPAPQLVAGAPQVTSPTVAAPPAPPDQTPERRAADLVIAGRYGDAITAYRELVAAHPERAEYATLVRVLERRVQHCQPGQSGQPCAGQ